MKRKICGILLLTIAALLAACAPEPVPGSEGYSVATVCAVGDIYLTDDMLADARKSGEEYDFTAQLSGIVPPRPFPKKAAAIPMPLLMRLPSRASTFCRRRTPAPSKTAFPAWSAQKPSLKRRA